MSGREWNRNKGMEDDIKVMEENESIKLKELVLASYMQSIDVLVKKAGNTSFLNEVMLNGVLPGEMSASEIVRLIKHENADKNFDEACIEQGLTLAYGGDKWTSGNQLNALVSLLSTLQIDNRPVPEKTFYKVSKLGKDSIFGKDTNKVSSEDYKKVAEDLEKDFLALKGLAYEDFVSSLDSLLLQYIWCVPAAEDKNVDISLYQISKLSASFASLLFRYHTMTESQTVDAVKNMDVNKFLFINGDISGIQKYIFDLKSADESSKLLRAKSFELLALSQVIAENLVMAVDGSIADIITTSGGKFLLVIPCTETSKNILAEKQLEYETFFLKEFVGKLGIIISDGTEANGEQLCSKEKVLQLINKIGEDGECSKQKKMQKALLMNGHVLNHLYEELQRFGECPSCGIRPSSGVGEGDKAEKCVNCRALADTGKKLVHAASIRINSNCVESIEKMVDFDGRWKNRSYAKINEYTPGRKVMYLPYVAPRKDNNSYELKTFADIAEVPKNGNTKLAMFKSDIDNLGLVFSSSLGENMCFARYSEMSRLFHYFFSAYYSDFVKQNYDNKIYTVFSGGDDLCVIGNWKDIMHFASDFHKKVEALTNKNPSVTLSAGITLFTGNVPLKYVEADAEEQLEKSKARMVNGKVAKNAVTVFDTTVSWEDYDIALEDGEKFEKSLLENCPEKEKLSVGVVYKMLDFAKRVQNIKNGSLNERDLMWKSNFRYMTSRNLSGKSSELKDWFNKFGADDGKMIKSKIAVSYGLYTQRKNEKQHNAEEE